MHSFLESLTRVRLAVQQPGVRGPLSAAIEAMSATLAGANVARGIGRRQVWVAFLPTGGSGAVPWRKFLILDIAYRDRGQAATPGRVALVAHELTHVLQRELSDPIYWPSGGLRLSGPGRWLGDSTTVMEVAAYIVGASVEWDLLHGLGRSTQRQSDWLAALTRTTPRDAGRAVVDHFPKNRIYRWTYRTEAKRPDRRIPPGDWADWLGAVGIDAHTLEHIRNQAAQGVAARGDVRPDST